MSTTNETSRGVVVKDGKVLLIHRSKNGNEFYTIPGGWREDNETIEESLIREIREEASISVKIDKFLGKFEGTLDGRAQLLFSCIYLSGEPQLEKDSMETKIMAQDPTNTYEPVWVPVEKLSSIVIQPQCARQAFMDFVSQKK